VIVEGAVAANGFSGERVTINRDVEFAAKHFQAANMIAVFVREQNAIELVGSDAALFQPQDELARTESAINEDFAVIGGDKGAISRAAAAEHGQTEHARMFNRSQTTSQIKTRVAIILSMT
jgi:hypothetical protein